MIALMSITLPSVHCSVVLAPSPFAYRQIAPQNVAPFAASVNTFTRGLSVYAAPYAAGVLPSPSLIPRAFLPAPVAPAFAAPSPLLPAPFAPGPPAFYSGVAPPLVPAPAGLVARSVHTVAPGLVTGYAAPAPLPW